MRSCAVSADRDTAENEVAETAQEVRSGVRLELRFDAAAETFTGSVVNTAAEPVSGVRVEVHLSNGIELGPTPGISLVPGETSSVRLAAAGQRFETWTTHVENWGRGARGSPSQTRTKRH